MSRPPPRSDDAGKIVSCEEPHLTLTGDKDIIWALADLRDPACNWAVRP